MPMEPQEVSEFKPRISRMITDKKGLLESASAHRESSSVKFRVIRGQIFLHFGGGDQRFHCAWFKSGMGFLNHESHETHERMSDCENAPRYAIFSCVWCVSWFLSRVQSFTLRSSMGSPPFSSVLIWLRRVAVCGSSPLASPWAVRSFSSWIRRGSSDFAA